MSWLQAEGHALDSFSGSRVTFGGEMVIDAKERNATAKRRQLEFFEALPQALKNEEDVIATVIRSTNASPRSKLQRIYRLTDAIMLHREPFVACKRGCADCCRMNVMISSEEAARIGAASGRSAELVQRSIFRDVDAFAGTPCPFLDSSNACSIYADRPLVCRNHGSFDEDAALCNPMLMNEHQMPRLQCAGIEDAFKSTLGKSSVLADIRDFFPT